MELKMPERSVEASGLGRQTSYTIKDKNRAHIFQVLRSRLYSNKPKAVIREYSTNAADEHRDAGYPQRPIEVTLPTTLSPIFKVRDYGRGLSAEGIEEVFTSYGESTKRDKVYLNGCLGFGSKSAFSYASDWNVISYYNGMKTVYHQYVDETLVGACVVIAEEPTDEPNGIEIEVMVKKEDVGTFHSIARDFYKHFYPTPIFHAGQQVEQEIKAYHAQVPKKMGTDWKLYGDGESVVVMANVAYPIDASALLPEDNRDYKLFNLLQRGGLVIYAPNGTINHAASREGLEYDQETISYLTDRLVRIAEEIRAETLQELNQSQSLWEARLRYNDLMNGPTWLTTLYEDATMRLKGREVVVERQINSASLTDVIVKTRVELRAYNDFKKDRLSSHTPTTITPSSKLGVVLYKRDFPRMDMTARLREAKKLYGFENALLVICPDAASANDFLAHKDFEGAPVIDLVNVPFVRVRAPKGSNPRPTDKRTCKVFEMVRNHRSSVNSDHWQCSASTPDKGKGVYIRIFNFAPSNIEHSWLSRNSTYMTGFNAMLDSVVASGLQLPDTIYGIREGVDLGAGWVSMGQWMEQELKKLLVDQSLVEAHMARQELCKIPDFYRDHMQVLREEIGENTPLRSFLDRLAKAKRIPHQDRLKAVEAMMDRLRLKLDITSSTNTLSLTEEMVQVEAVYPMLSVIRSDVYPYYLKNRHKQEFLKYLEFVANHMQ